MNKSFLRLLGVTMISLAALAFAGEPVPAFDDAALTAASGDTFAIACEETPMSEAEAAEVSEQRSRTAMRLRWAVTLPDSSRPLSISLPL